MSKINATKTKNKNFKRLIMFLKKTYNKKAINNIVSAMVILLLVIQFYFSYGQQVDNSQQMM